MKISNKVDFDQLPNFVNQQLTFLSISQVKWIVAVFTFVGLDLGVLPLLYPKVTLIYLIGIPALIFIHIWAIRLLFKNPFATQFETIRFIAILSVVGVICYFMLIQKIAYFVLRIRSTTFYMLTTAGYVVIIAGLLYSQFYKYRHFKLAHEERKETKLRNQHVQYVFLVLPAVGYMLSQKVLKQSEIMSYWMMYFVYSLFLLVFSYFLAKYVHKSMFLKANPQFVTYHKPSRKRVKQAEAKGRTIRIG